MILMISEPPLYIPVTSPKIRRWEEVARNLPGGEYEGEEHVR
jgi:hypothetical protein